MNEMQPQTALARWSVHDPIFELADGGLINRTWTVGEPPWAVLQWVNPIFDPKSHLDIEAVTSRLEDMGLTTPRLVPSPGGELFTTDKYGCWRLLTFIPGKTLHRLETTDQAASAGHLVGRFHAALNDWHHHRAGRWRHIHDTVSHMAELHAARGEAPGHELGAEATELADEIFHRWSRWQGDLEPRLRYSHGDLKVSNLRFDTDGEHALCLIDLDTLGSMPIACEMGDAWRSWCNPAGEDDPQASAFDVDLFAASARAWLAAAPPLNDDELRSLVPGIERICLELAARFCADAVRNTYFREDHEKHPRPGRHNLVRARGQLALATSVRQAREECEAVVASARRAGIPKR